MTTRPRMLTVCAAVALALGSAGGALAASPQTIYEDLADNGRLDGKYDHADIVRALDLEQVVRTDARKPPPQRPEATTPPASSKRSTSGLPFTGLDLALLTAGGGPLLLIGLGLRRRLAGPATSSRAEAVRG